MISAEAAVPAVVPAAPRGRIFSAAHVDLAYSDVEYRDWALTRYHVLIELARLAVIEIASSKVRGPRRRCD